MALVYKRATPEDINTLTKTRIEVLRAANNYYQKALCDGSHIAYLVFDGKCFAGKRK